MASLVLVAIGLAFALAGVGGALRPRETAALSAAVGGADFAAGDADATAIRAWRVASLASLVIGVGLVSLGLAP